MKIGVGYGGIQHDGFLKKRDRTMQSNTWCISMRAENEKQTNCFALKTGLPGVCAGSGLPDF